MANFFARVDYYSLYLWPFLANHRSMPKILIRTVAAIAAFSAVTGVRADENREVVMPLDSCIAIALSDNPTIKIADMEVTRLDYSRKETLGQLLPTVDFGASYNRMLAKQVAYMNMDRFGSLGGGGNGSDNGGETPESRASDSKPAGIKMGLDNSYSVGFQAAVPLIAPQLWKTLKLSDSQILQQYEQARTSRLEMVNSVKSAYYALLLALDSQRTIKESYDMAVFTADLYAKQYELGAASQYDVLRTEVQVKNVEPEMSQAEIAVKQAQLQLSVLMALLRLFPLRFAHSHSVYFQKITSRSKYSNSYSLSLIFIFLPHFLPHTLSDVKSTHCFLGGIINYINIWLHCAIVTMSAPFHHDAWWYSEHKSV